MGTGGPWKGPTAAPENSIQVAGCPQCCIQGMWSGPTQPRPPHAARPPPSAHSGPPGAEGIRWCLPGEWNQQQRPGPPAPPWAPGRVFPESPSAEGLWRGTSARPGGHWSQTEVQEGWPGSAQCLGDIFPEVCREDDAGQPDGTRGTVFTAMTQLQANQTESPAARHWAQEGQQPGVTSLPCLPRLQLNCRKGNR